MAIYNAYKVNTYKVKDTGEVKEDWKNIGTAFSHGDGKGFNLEVPDGIAVSGKICIRERKGKDDQPDAEAAAAFNGQ